ncbi:MAG: hypothetical protein H7145_04515 [Akkermansiaceae bacterium]|nr:hypothetical protein [Armatimonadota bacterium]
MNKPAFTAAAFITAILLFPVTAAVAQSKKEPLTLKKIGKNIGRETTRAGKNIGKESTRAYKNGEYGVRKGGENVSQTTHRALGKDSTVLDRGKKKTQVVKPDGTRVPTNKKPGD